MHNPLLSVTDLTVSYRSRNFFSKKSHPAIQDISFDLNRGTILGIVGESGSGKTTLLRALLRLIAVDNGSILFDGLDWLAIDKQQLKIARRKIGVVSQNPFLSLSPRLTIDKILAEPLQAAGRQPIDPEQLVSALQSVGLGGDFLYRKPQALSGGQAQRVAIARALLLQPGLLILDEATSALDVSVQAQILNLLLDLQNQMQLSMLFVSHDIAIVQHISNELMVMRDGTLVEKGRTEDLIEHPKNDYTRQLMTARQVTSRQSDKRSAAT